jgi:succinate dehydrogenase/fumarate reductase flavoprotein subunit
MTEHRDVRPGRGSAFNLSRRGLLRAGAGGAALAAAPIFAAAQDATPAVGPDGGALVSTTMPGTWDQETDVVVVGSGGAAFAAAVTARQAGAEVIMLERASMIGGTTELSGNEYWIPNNSKMRAAGKTDPRDDALKYMARLSYPQLYDPESPTLGLMQRNYDLIATFYDTGSVAVDAFEEWGALYSRVQASFGYSEEPDFADPDYSADLPEDKAPYGRGIQPDPDRGGSGTVPGQMKVWTDKNGVPLLTEHRVVGVFQNRDGAVVGVRVDNNGTTLAIRARKAVIFGTGGFTQDATKSLNYLRGPIFAGCGVPTCTGDFVDIGLALGAELGNMNQAWWLQAPLELALTSPALTGADVWMPWGDSMVIVNRFGDRIMSEKITYNERGQVHHYWDPGRREYLNLVQFMIYDDAVAQDPAAFPFRFPIPAAGEDSDYVIKGNTWEELAANIGARLDSLRGQGTISARVGPDVVLADDFVDRLGATIARFNGFAEMGIDEDFGRGSTPIQVAWGGGTSRHSTNPNPTMAPFAAEGPYYCILLGGMTLDTKGGPVIDTGARVQHVSGRAIPGLYGAGNCIASPAGQAYWSGGGTIGPAITYGYIAGLNAAAEPEKAVS